MKCHQCDRPAIYAINGNIPLCLQCFALHSSIIERQVEMHERAADRALDDMEMISGVRLQRNRPAPRPAPVVLQGATFNHINIANSNVGMVNTGQLSQVDSAVHVIEKGGDKGLADALRELTEKTVRHASLSDAQRAEIVELLSALASEATQPKELRRKAVTAPLIARLREVLAVSADLIGVLQPALRVIGSAFGLT